MLISRNLAEEKVLHFDKFHEQESRNYSPPKMCENVNKIKILMTKLEL